MCSVLRVRGLTAKYSLRESMPAYAGGSWPMHFRMSQSWSTSLSPGNRGSPVNISTAMQPAMPQPDVLPCPEDAHADCVSDSRHALWATPVSMQPKTDALCASTSHMLHL